MPARGLRVAHRRLALVLLLLVAPGTGWADPHPPRKFLQGEEPSIPLRHQPPVILDGYPEAAPRGGRASVPVAAPSGMHYAIESGGVAFGILIPDQASELPGAIRIRIVSDSAWVLKVAAPPQFLVSQEGETVPIRRMSWRSALSGVYVPLHDGQPVVVARGPATTVGPRLVTLDLRMQLQENDPVGQYECSLRIFLEPL